ncbi:MAG: PorP/SprF family type IX secretion system membrane protein [Chitinophagales bacterium]|nr:PorP/SprF family type IX secretion system membrane protein [Chitinophagales bacterium]
MRVKILIIALLAIQTSLNAQDPNFAQYYNFRVFLNPAATGSEKGLNVAAIYKNQWSYVPSGFNTYGISADIQSARLSSGVGIIAYRDVEAKALIKNYVGASYAYIVRISKSFNLHIGLKAAFVNNHLDQSKLIFSDQLDPETGYDPGVSNGIDIPIRKVNYFDLDAGILARFKFDIRENPVHNSIGFAVSHLTQPDESYLNIATKVPMRFTVHYGSMFPIFGNKYKREPIMYISPVFKFDYQNKIRVYNAGFFTTFKPLYSGIMYQLNKLDFNNTHGLIITGGINWDMGMDEAMTLNVGYSYQMDFTGVETKSRGQHEITMRLNFNNVALYSPKKSKPKRIDCYDFPGKKAVKLF